MSDLPDIPPEFLELLKQIKGKRARLVVAHILEHGFVTTEELESQYGYNHPPRAIRDVREQGIPIETFRVKNLQGRDIAAYRFGDLSKVYPGRIGGRRAFPKVLKKRLLNDQSAICGICNQQFSAQFLQIDHRIPYEVAGNTEDYVLLCGSCNRAKSWSCEHCNNWKELKNPALCLTCYWANPAMYEHIALQQIRRLDLVWDEDELNDYAFLEEQAIKHQQTLSEYIKTMLKRRMDDK